MSYIRSTLFPLEDIKRVEGTIEKLKEFTSGETVNAFKSTSNKTSNRRWSDSCLCGERSNI